MKTFDEAFAAVNKSTTLDQDLHDFGTEGMNNPNFVDLIQKLALTWMIELQRIPEGKCLAYTCATLQALFNIGMKTGIEMEKQ